MALPIPKMSSNCSGGSSSSSTVLTILLFNRSIVPDPRATECSEKK